MNTNIVVGKLYCHLRAFEINGKGADEEEFGFFKDESPCAYGCGNMKFISFDIPSQELLDKYKITEEEYEEIVSTLEKELSFGECNLCGPDHR